MTKRSTSFRAHRALRIRPLILALCGAGCLSETQVLAAPELPILDGQATAPVVGSGSVSTNIDQTARTYTQTTDLAVWHFSSFNIGAGGSVHNQAPKTSDLTIFRVMGASQSVLQGPLTANNRLILVNRNGIHAQDGASFSGGGSLVMSAQDLHPELTANDYEKLKANKAYIRFVGDSYIRSGYGGYSTIYNNTYGSPFGYGEGIVEIDAGVRMVAGDGGSIFLVGDRVINRGTLIAPGGGSVGLVASGKVELEMAVGDSGFITLTSHEKLDVENTQGGGNTGIVRVALNQGEIQAEDGQVILAQASYGGTSDYSGMVPTPTVVREQLNTEWPPGGAYNTGTINAKGTNGGQGRVTLEAKGYDNVAVNTGTVDASAANGESMAGTIRLSAARVLHDGEYNDGETRSTASLLANGPRGGGRITLDTASAPADSESGSLVHVGSFGRIEASATGANGNGGTVQLGNAVPAIDAQWRPTDEVGLQGRVDVRGAGNGLGGTLETAGRYVDVGRGNLKDRVQLGAGGLWRLVSTGLTVGTSFLDFEGGPGSTYVNPADIAAMLDQGVNVTMQSRHTGAEGSLAEEGYLYIEPGAGISRTAGTGSATLTFESTNDLVVGQGASITSTTGPLNVTLQSDVDKNGAAGSDGRGSLIIGASPVTEPVQRAQPSSVAAKPAGDRAQPQAAAVMAVGPQTVVINTNGGNLVLDGAGRPRQTQVDPVGDVGVAINNAQLNAGSGKVTITGHGGDGAGGASANGVTLTDAEIIGGDTRIRGSSVSATGVSLSKTTLTYAGTGNRDGQGNPTGISVIGTSEGGSGTSGQRIGVDVRDDVVINSGRGDLKIHGLARGGAGVGLSIQQLKIMTDKATEQGATEPLVTLAGQSDDASGAGLALVGGTAGSLVLQGQPQAGGTAVQSSTADIIIGASAGPGAQEAIVIAANTPAPQFNTTGRINIRPVSMESNEPSQIASLNTQDIHVGNRTQQGGTNFNIDPRWLTPASPGARYVIGSSTHTGAIGVGAGALNNARDVSLQNQGAGSKGMTLAAQTNSALKLSLLTTGDIAQTGPLVIDTLNIKMGPGSDVQLVSTDNRFNFLNFDGSPASPNVAGAARTNSGDPSITGFDGAAATFQALSINAVVTTPPTDPERPTIDGDDVDRTFEGTDLMSELRTDVYVHGQLSRPQLCTPANTDAAASVGEGGADPLALEWVKVRRGPQLTNCAGMKADSSCSAF